MVLDIVGGSSKNGANNQIYQDNESAAQQFNVTDIESGWHKICNTVSGKALDVTNGIVLHIRYLMLAIMMLNFLTILEKCGRMC
jgi:hypothetical protein